MTLHLELDLQNVEVKRQAKHLRQRSSHLLQSYCPNTQTHLTDCSTWTIKMVSNKTGGSDLRFQSAWKEGLWWKYVDKLARSTRDNSDTLDQW